MREILRFLITGFASTIINYLVFFFLYSSFSVEYIFASAIGYVSGVFFGFKLNANWTFKVSNENQNKIVFIKYFAIYIINLLISLALLRYLVEIIKIIPEFSNILCIIFTTISNYILVKYFVFKK